MTGTKARELTLMFMWVAMAVWIIVVIALTYGWI